VIGTTLGRYRIGDTVGKGGMGTVYRARDTRLGREVAVKVLPDKLASDADRLARFEREARVLASLNHPNIATLFGLEEHEGRRFLIMELVEGETLEKRLVRAAVPVHPALELARQIAAGLEAAHECGVIHRDLKPANIMVTPEGVVKVLDFGLAKALTPEQPESDPEDSPTLSASTSAGTILGTAPYMSPEQARGQAIDRRTDIWAFGCVLFEMLTGTRAFPGDTVTDVLVAVIEREPDWTLLPAAAPRRVVELLHKCLRKDPRRRFRDAGDAGLELEEPDDLLAATSEPISAKPGRFVSLVPWAVALAAVVLSLWSVVTERSLLQGPSVRSVRLITDQPEVVGVPSLSPDGDTVAFEAGGRTNTDIFVQRVGGRRPINITKECQLDDSTPAFSPDGEMIAFRSECGVGGLFVMGATGESVRRVTDFGHHPAWSPDGRQLVFASEVTDDPSWQTGDSELWAVDLATGETRRILAGNASAPRWSPDGRWIAFEAMVKGSKRDVWVVAAEESSNANEPAQITVDAAEDRAPQWSPDGSSLHFVSERSGAPNLWRVSIDLRSGRSSGEPQPVTLPVACSGLSFSGDGSRLAFLRAVEQSSLERLDVDPATGERQGQPRTILRSTRNFEGVSVSPDDQWIAGRLLPDRDLFLVRADGTGMRRITKDSFDDRTPAWYPDGSGLVFSSNRGEGYALWSIRSDGSELRRLTPEDTDCAAWPDWSPDGRLLFSGESGSCLWEAESQGSLRLLRVLPQPAEDRSFWPSWWSPDGRQMLGAAMPAGGTYSAETVAFDIDTGEFRRCPHLDGVYSCQSLADGEKYVCTEGPNGARAVVDFHTGESTVVLSDAEGQDVWSWDLAPSREWLCLVRRHDLREIWLAELQ
jgi:serine/threonine protein kinase/Tol biopolymer transport system component